MVQVQVERDRIIKAEILPMDRISLQQARTEGDDLPVLPPDKETVLVTEAGAKAAEIILGQFLEVQTRPVINIQI